MVSLFDKTFFKFLCGFIGVLTFSFAVFAAAEAYKYTESAAYKASVFASYE